MPGNALAGLAKGLVNRANRGVNNAKGSIFGVAGEAIKGQYAAEAQERNFGHSRQIIKDLHKNAGQGTGVDFHVQSGEHVVGGKYTKKMIGEDFLSLQEKQAMKNFRAANKGGTTTPNPTRNAQGYRENQPDHVGNAKAAITAKPMLALSAPKSGSKKPTESSSAPEAQDNTRRFVTDSKGKTRSVDRRDSSFEAHLADSESAYLESRKAAQKVTDASKFKPNK